jgi:hypothetical protein
MKLFIGIDPGVKTGFATFDPLARKLTALTGSTHKIWESVKVLNKLYDVVVYIEDARLRNWYGKQSKEKQQGAGAIKIQCTLWQQFLDDNEISYHLVAPKNTITKITKEHFAFITGFTARTSNHARDAAMLVYGRK